MLTAGVRDLDAYLDAAGVNSIFLSPETDGWSHNCLLDLFFPDIVGIYKSLLSHSLALNWATQSQSHLSELGWPWRLCHLLFSPPLLFHIMPYNASLRSGQDAAEGDRISAYSAIPAPRGAWDAGWRSLFCHYSLELLTAKECFRWISAPLQLHPHHPWP